MKDDHKYVVMASRLPLLHHRHIPGFLRDTMMVRRQLAEADGLVAYALDAQLLHKTFWTLSVWESRGQLRAFNHADPHRRRAAGLGGRMAPSSFVFWDCPGLEVSGIGWKEARTRLAKS